MPIGSKINVEQKDVLLKKVIERAKKLFTSDEKELCVVVQQKPVVNLLPHSIIVTNRRIIRHLPGILRVKFEDYLWKDLIDVHLSERLLGGRLKFRFGNGSFVIDKLPKDQSKRVYAIAQEREEEWVERKRMRMIEESRAKSGATFLHVGKDGQKVDVKSKLVELKTLLDESLITQDEYDSKKAELLKRI
jgi:hypothetical protein|tara:strand:- start:490 stop:1059 length:570 start_codon:yes stop_codon:yes gene_type:complete